MNIFKRLKKHHSAMVWLVHEAAGRILKRSTPCTLTTSWSTTSVSQTLRTVRCIGELGVLSCDMRYLSCIISQHILLPPLHHVAIGRRNSCVGSNMRCWVGCVELWYALQKSYHSSPQPTQHRHSVKWMELSYTSSFTRRTLYLFKIYTNKLIFCYFLWRCKSYLC